MHKVFLDTDVLLDLLLEREKFVAHARTIFQRIELGKIAGYTSPVILSNLYYLSSNLKNKRIAISNIRKIHQILKITKVDQQIIDSVLKQSIVIDFEDYIQLYSAVGEKVDFLVTRNKKHYPKNSGVKIITPEELAHIIESEEKTG